MPKANDFWSRRRRAVAAEEEERAHIEDEAERQAAEAELETVDDETLLQMLGLPDPETLTPTDAARFMAREVPGRLRKRALRALFRSHPSLSLPDGLNDYDKDYVNAPLAPRPLRPVWTPVQRAAEAISAETAEPRFPAPAFETPDDDTPEALQVEDEGGDPDEAQPLRPRRMTFRFEETET